MSVDGDEIDVSEDSDEGSSEESGEEENAEEEHVRLRRSALKLAGETVPVDPRLVAPRGAISNRPWLHVAMSAETDDANMQVLVWVDTKRGARAKQIDFWSSFVVARHGGYLTTGLHRLPVPG